MASEIDTFDKWWMKWFAFAPESVLDRNGNVDGKYWRGCWNAAWAAATERAAKACEAEAQLYIANGKRCDSGGNTFGGSMDAASASALNRIAVLIRTGEGKA